MESFYRASETRKLLREAIDTLNAPVDQAGIQLKDEAISHVRQIDQGGDLPLSAAQEILFRAYFDGFR